MLYKSIFYIAAIIDRVNKVNSSKLTYRAEIDGLRAIAVVSVIFYHAQMVLFGRDWFKGGFIGVDIFFVISGYLITRIILSELEEKDSFSFLNFYERRARRILPMLFLVILATSIFAYVLLGSADLIELAYSAITALFFSSNIFFFFNTTEYGADSALLKPFLHTWSLGVEEQFYLVFPILAIIVFKFFRKQFLAILVGLSLLSLQFAELMEVRNADLNFYLPFSRFWELAVGSMLAYRELYYKPSKDGIASKFLPMLGLYLTAYSILFFDGKTPHPSFYTLLPIIGVALIIGFASKDELVGKLLGSKPLVLIGLVSYSAYLWHFPIMSLFRIAHGSLHIPPKWALIIFILTLVLSATTYRYVERPFRSKNSISSGKFAITLLAFVGLLVSASIITVKSEGFPDRYPSSIQRESFDDRFANIDIVDKCHRLKGREAVKEDEFCKLGDSSKSVYLIGDSHMVSIAFKLFEKILDKDLSLILMTRAGALYGKKEKLDEARLKYLKDVENSIVVIGGYAHAKNAEFFKKKRESYEALLSMLERNGNTVVVVYPIPSTNINRRTLKFEYLGYGRLLDKQSSFDDFASRSSDAYKFYDSLPYSFYKIYPSSFLCDQSHCFGVKDENILISDVDHPSSITAEWIVSEILDSLDL